MAAPPPPPPKGGLSLYENLHDPNDPTPAATISSAPVLYNQDDPNASGAASAKKSIDPAFRFQPVRRPQPKQQKPKATFPKAIPKASIPPSAPAAEAPEAAVPTPPSSSSVPKSTLADWAATEEDEWRYGAGEKRQRGGRKKKKKQQQQHFETDWDDIYDPSRPTNVEEYLKSDEKIDEVREWKALLYAHRKSRQHSDSSDDERDQDTRPTNQFAPPPSYAFVPPPPQSPPAAVPAAPPPDDATGDDAYARRLALSNQPQQAQPPPPPPPPPPEAEPPSSATISAAPVRYAQPDPEEAYSPPPTFSNNSNTDEIPQQPRTNLPGQAGFAHRLMSKYGWQKGSGLGATSSGIINPLRVQVEKRRRKADADGGGWAEPGGRGKIIGGHTKRKGDGEQDSPGDMSEVIVLHHMLDNMPDLATEIEDGLGQEIGQECGEKYGRVERLFIDPSTRRVFIKFTDQVSALRAVNELKGRIFNGNTIAPKFYNVEQFENGVYTA